ncbi:WD40 repeat domain-containing protein [Rhodopirellula sp. JC639]|uniref:WD40 repeat domain-containing protein n=1 Tax=Stieleria mannarensis TaxID=2755585 RepID=UPI0015FFB18D|nr:WD40 repeat domain-containing protein [Rhodopirellula sp. JC639]
MSRIGKLLILLAGLLVAFPFLYPLIRTFFRGDAVVVRPQSDASNRADGPGSSTTTSRVARDADSRLGVTEPDLPSPDLVAPAIELSQTDGQSNLRLVLHMAGAPRESFQLLVGAAGRSSVHTEKPILASPRGRNVQFWDLETGSLIDTRRIDPTADHTFFTSASYSPDGQLIALGSPYGPMRLLRPDDDSLVPIPTDRSINADRIAFHPDGQRFVAVGERTPEGRNIPNAHWVDLGNEQVHQLVPDDVTVVDANISDDGASIAIAGMEALSIYDTPSLERRVRFPLAEQPTFVTPSPDGNWILGLSNGNVRIWSEATAGFVAEGNLDTGHRPVIAIDRFDDSNRYCVLTGEEEILIWDRDTGSTRVIGHHDTAHHVRALAGQQGVITVGYNNGTRIWPLPSVEATAPQSADATADDEMLAWSRGAVSSDGSTIAAVGKYVHVWNASDGKCLATFEPKTRWIHDVHLSPDGSLIALVGQGLTTEVWSVTEGRPFADYADPTGESRWPANIDRHSRCVRFSDDGQRLLVAEQDALRIYDVQSRERVIELAEVARQTGTVRISMIQAMDVHEQSGRIALAQTGRVVIWDPENERVLKTVQTRGSVDSEHPGVFFSKDGKRIAVGHLYRLAVYDIDSGRVVDELRSHWVHGRWGDDWLVSDRAGQLSRWSSATEPGAAYERGRRSPNLEPLMKTHGQLKSIALTDDGLMVIVDQGESPLVYRK